jgi:hypothetical protein
VTDPTKPGDPADKAADGAFGGVTSHRAGYGDKLARVEDWLRRHPTATLASGEGAVLLAEIDRLRAELAKTKPIADAAAAYYTAFIDQRDYGDTVDQTWEALFATVHAAYPELGSKESA